MNLRISAATLDFYVDVWLRNFDGRWLAVAEIAGDPEIGLGWSAREALTESLSSLGALATAALLADVQVAANSTDLS